ncbi:MAG TPA: hypothetical protein VK658_25195 [Chryseolinea sp.]|nr:hypothetical protein [Chryseolinea sp.]
MTKQKKVFRAIAIVFALLLGYASYDIASRTTFPGSKPQLKERIKKNFFESDSIADSLADDTLKSRALERDSLGMK